MNDYYALERMTLQQTCPVRRYFMDAWLGGDFEIVRSHASYNELCFVEHVLGRSEEQSWAAFVEMWVEIRAGVFP